MIAPSYQEGLVLKKTATKYDDDIIWRYAIRP